MLLQNKGNNAGGSSDNDRLVIFLQKTTDNLILKHNNGVTVRKQMKIV